MRVTSPAATLLPAHDGPRANQTQELETGSGPGTTPEQNRTMDGTSMYFYIFILLHILVFFFIGICKDSLGLLQKTVLLNITQMTTLVILQIPFRKKI